MSFGEGPCHPPFRTLLSFGTRPPPKTADGLTRLTDIIEPLGTAVADKARSLLLIDDHQLINDLIGRFLPNYGAYSITTAPDLDAGLAAIAASGSFDVVLLDLVLPGMNGITSVQNVVQANGSGAVVIFSGSVSHDFVQQALGIGVRGYIPKTLPLRSLATAIDFVATGQVFLPSTFFSDRQAAINSPSHSLSPRELQVLTFVSEGKTNKEIAWSLDVSEATIKMHMRAVCEKLHARNRTHAVILGKQSRII